MSGMTPLERNLRQHLGIARREHSSAHDWLKRALASFDEAKANLKEAQETVERWSKDIEQTAKVLDTYPKIEGEPPFEAPDMNEIFDNLFSKRGRMGR